MTVRLETVTSFIFLLTINMTTYDLKFLHQSKHLSCGFAFLLRNNSVSAPQAAANFRKHIFLSGGEDCGHGRGPLHPSTL